MLNVWKSWNVSVEIQTDVNVFRQISSQTIIRKLELKIFNSLYEKTKQNKQVHTMTQREKIHLCTNISLYYCLIYMVSSKDKFTVLQDKNWRKFYLKEVSQGCRRSHGTKEHKPTSLVQDTHIKTITKIPCLLKKKQQQHITYYNPSNIFPCIWLA